MTFFPASAALLAIWLVLTLRDLDNSLRVTVAVLPFGMFAAMILSGMSLLAAHLVAALTIGLFVLRWVASRRMPGGLHLSAPGVFLLVFSLWSAFSATVLVRLFAGKFLVFPMTVSSRGIRVSDSFPSTMFPLAPGNSNISQTLYILLSCGFFLVAAAAFARRGPRFGEAAIVWAAMVNLVLGLLDLLGLDPLLALIRTAAYTLNNEHTLAGLPRVIGGFAEASSFGAFSAALFAYFMASVLIGRRPRDGLLALATLACAAVSLSSSGIVSLGAAGLILMLHAGIWLGAGMPRAFGHWFVILVAAAIGLGCVVLLTSSAPEFLGRLLDSLIFSKGESESGLERGAWAASGLAAFRETWGLGAGAGSLRSNGLLAVLLGSVGLPGTLAFAGFLWCAFGPAGAFPDPGERRVFYAARISALTLLAGMMISATTPEPGLQLMALAALAAAVRQRARASRRRARPAPPRRPAVRATDPPEPASGPA